MAIRLIRKTWSCGSTLAHTTWSELKILVRLFFFEVFESHLLTVFFIANTLTNLATSSILFSPWNYFDADVSMESRQSLQLNPPEPGQLWEPTGHISPSFCMPAKPKPVHYQGMISWEEDGKLSPPGSVVCFVKLLTIYWIYILIFV